MGVVPTPPRARLGANPTGSGTCVYSHSPWSVSACLSGTPPAAAPELPPPTALVPHLKMQSGLEGRGAVPHAGSLVVWSVDGVVSSRAARGGRARRAASTLLLYRLSLRTHPHVAPFLGRSQTKWQCSSRVVGWSCSGARRADHYSTIPHTSTSARGLSFAHRI